MKNILLIILIFLIVVVIINFAFEFISLFNFKIPYFLRGFVVAIVSLLLLTILINKGRE